MLLVSILIACMLMLTASCIFTPDLIILIKSAEYAVHFVFLFVFLGLAFLILDQSNLLITAFYCAGILSFFLKQNAHSQLQLAHPSSAPKTSVCLITTYAFDHNPEEELSVIRDLNADVLGILGVTPDWHEYLIHNLSDIYPHHADLVRIDPFGQIILSKTPLANIDTFEYGGIPSLSGFIEMEDGLLCRIQSLQLEPNYDMVSHKAMRNYLEFLGGDIQRQAWPKICMGDFQAVPWSQEIQAFKYISEMIDSRRSYNVGFPVKWTV